MRTSNKTSTSAAKTSFAIGKNQNIIIIFFTLIRIFIGWHFLYEGLIKLFSPWSSAGYLLESQWLFSGVFHWIAENSGVLSVVDMLNIAGMILIGVSLFLGLFTRISAFTGALLLLLYYIANPPFIGFMGEATGEGHYLIVNKQLIETALLFAIVFLPRDFFWSIDRWIIRLKQKREKEEEETQSAVTTSGRREMVKDLIALPILGAFSWLLIKKR
jgi:thiosulfate dehydrogenase [quinone] large subunit